MNIYNTDLINMDGVITFYSSQQAVRAERTLKKNGYKVMLIPGPREISPNCGVALCFEYNREKEVRLVLIGNRAFFEDIHYYPNAKRISKWVN